MVFKSSKIYGMMEGQSKKIKSNILDEKGVVYKIKCKECEMKSLEMQYIGETGRKLGVRIKEHSKVKGNSSNWTEVGCHLRSEHGDVNEREAIEVEIIEREKDEMLRKMKEAMWIEKIKPRMNKSDGINVIGKEWF